VRVSGDAARRFLSLCRRAGAGEPPQYLVHSAPFLDLDLYVDSRVLIPRPETEELVLRTAAWLENRPADAGRPTPVTGRRPVFLDYGTGSGCIAIALARRFPRARLIATDRSAPALQVCSRNVSRHRLGRRIRIVRASTPDDPVLRRLGDRLDLLVSNPPYVPSARVDRLPRRVRDFEPRLALDGGPKGTNIVAMLLASGLDLLRSGGLLAIEIDYSNERYVRRAAPAVCIERDPAGLARYAFLTKES
jgi:release factor glutamine methyltransferase